VNYWLMNVRDAAHITELPVRTIQRWLLNGWLPDHGNGVTYLIDMRELSELAEQRPGLRLRRSDLVT
jgi:hypothetical protein